MASTTSQIRLILTLNGSSSPIGGTDSSGKAVPYLILNKFNYGVNNYAQANVNDNTSPSVGQSTNVNLLFEACPATTLLQDICFRGTPITAAIENHVTGGTDGNLVLQKTYTFTNPRMIAVNENMDSNSNGLTSASITYQSLKIVWANGKASASFEQPKDE